MLPGFEAIETTEHMDFGADPDRRILLLVRKPSGKVGAAELERALHGVQATLGYPSDWSILFDTRRAVGRSGPEFEQEVERFRAYMLDHFVRVAVLVQSAIGEMQVQRFQDPKARMLVFRDLDQAFAFLTRS